MPAAYEIRAGGDVKNKKQSMADLKLRRLNELNMRLKEDLERPRIRVSEASMRYSVSNVAILGLSYITTRSHCLWIISSLIAYCNQTRDYMVPSLWGQVSTLIAALTALRAFLTQY